MHPASPALEILLPVHNEADSIEAVVREIFEELAPQVSVRFLVCEDGSRDNTKEILRLLSLTIPMNLILTDERKGYSKAVKDGMKALATPYLLCLDSDGQCDPKDFAKFWNVRAKSDVVLGWRVNRADTPLRKVMSRAFYGIYQLFFRVPVHDPSCPYVLVRKDVVDQLVDELGAMQQGFWWEFVARVHRHGFSIQELQINHRKRLAGTTQVYKLRKLPGIGWHHFLALFKIWSETSPASLSRRRQTNLPSAACIREQSSPHELHR
jgi:glycosyltransferase involved in cell wall biosynthesis